MNPLIEQIKAILSLPDLITRSGLTLKRSGRHLEGCCPFHEEKSPSFKVYSATNTFKCYGCGKTGDVLSWIGWDMFRDVNPNKEQFMEVLKAACEKAGIEYKASGGAAAKNRRQAETILEQFIEVAKHIWTKDALKRAQEYKEYIDLELIERWSLGYSPTLNQCKKGGMTEASLKFVGLLKEGKNDAYMHFRDSIIIPYFHNGRVVFISDRGLGKRPKGKLKMALPGPKNRKLFAREGVKYPDGFNLDAIGDVRKSKGDLLLVEGIFDAIACTERGHPAVAMMTSRPSKGLIKLLERDANK